MSERVEAWKVVGLAAMVIDHLGVVIWPDCLFLRVLGRVAFPLFLLSVVAASLEFSREPWRYALRLFGCGIVSQIVLWDWFGTRGNIMFSLGLALVACLAVRERDWVLALSSVVLGSLCQYGWPGVAAGVVFGVWWQERRLVGAFVAGWVLVWLANGAEWVWVPGLVLAAGLVVWSPRWGWGRITGRWLYLFYPGHLCFLRVFGSLIR